MSISSISSQKDLWYILQQQRNKAQNSSNNAATATDASSVDSTDVKSFLDKVKAGTVSDSDLSSMQTALTKLQEQYGTSSSSLVKPDDELSNFLDKVQSGTVTTDDLSSMKTTLSQASNNMEKHFGPPPPGGKPPQGKNDGGALGQIDDFLSKVQEGSVTDSDLTTIQALLKSMASASDEEDEDEDESSSTSVASAASSSALSNIQSFLDKIKDGTASDSDLNSLQKTLTALKTNATSNSASNDSENSDASYSQNSSTRYLMEALAAYKQNSGVIDLYNEKPRQNYII